MNATRRRRFSLMEIMVVVVIIGLLAGIVITNAMARAEEARHDMTKVTLQQVADALDLYKLKIGQYPTNEQGLKVLTEGDAPQLRKIPIDAWNNEIQYQYPGTRGKAKYDIWSYGANGTEGGEGPDADIYYGEETEK